MKLILERWNKFLTEFKEKELSFPLQILNDVFEQAKFAYESLLLLYDKLEGLQEAKEPKSRGRKSLIRLIKLAQEQEWELWYEKNYQTIEKVFSDAGIDDPSILKKFLLILAATSQGSNPAANVAFAIKGLRNIYIDQYTDTEQFYRTSDPNKKGEYLRDVAANLARIARGEDIQGPKVGPYSRALAGNEEAIAVDRHIFDIFFGSTGGTKSKRAFAKKEIQAIATRLGLKPRQVQAALWAANQMRTGKTPGNYTEVINKKLNEINLLLKEINEAQGDKKETI